MNTKGNLQYWQVTVLSPVHIGDGEQLIPDFDYRQAKGLVQVIHLDDVINALADFPDAVKEMSRSQFSLSSLMANYKLSISPLYTLRHIGSRPGNIRRFIKDAHGRPYFPGSSLKGAIRTALWTTLSRDNLPSVTQYDDFQNAVERIDGEDPHHDFLRPFQISDSTPVLPGEALELAEIKFFNLISEKESGWKSFTRHGTVKNFQDARGIYVEALRPGIQVCITAVLDTFLTEEPLDTAGLLPRCDALIGFSKLAKNINEYSLALARREKEFFRQFEETGPWVAAFYQNLIRDIESVMKTQGSFILRLAWGSGWKGMTGDWLEDGDLEVVRKKKLLGKVGCPSCKSSRIKWDKKQKKYVCQNNECGQVFTEDEMWIYPVFPKTRRLAMKDGTPSLPLGWVKVEPISKEEYHRKIAQISSKEAVSTDATVFRDIKVNQLDSDEVRKDKIASFKAKLEKVQNLPGEISSFIGEIKSVDGRSLQQELCRILLTNAMGLKKKKNFKRALESGKVWAKQLKALCDDLEVR